MRIWLLLFTAIKGYGQVRVTLLFCLYFLRHTDSHIVNTREKTLFHLTKGKSERAEWRSSLSSSLRPLNFCPCQMFLFSWKTRLSILNLQKIALSRTRTFLLSPREDQHAPLSVITLAAPDSFCV